MVVRNDRGDLLLIELLRFQDLAIVKLSYSLLAVLMPVVEGMRILIVRRWFHNEGLVIEVGLVQKIQVDWGERGDHVLEAIVLLDKLVIALCELANLLLGGILGRRQ